MLKVLLESDAVNDNELKEILIQITLDIAREYGNSEELLKRLKTVMDGIGK